MPVPTDNGPHYSLIKQRMPDWLQSTSGPRAHALSRVPLTRLVPLLSSHSREHAPVKAANAKAWTTQNSVDQRLKDLKDAYAFAEPLLAQSLFDRYGLDLDVRATHVFLVITKGTVAKGSISRTLSLLDAALQNFSVGEPFADDSNYITRPDARGHFTIEPHKGRMSIAQFVALCRELDLGARYALHLQHHLLPAQATDQRSLQTQVIASQQAALNNAAHLAQLHDEIDTATFHLLQRTVKGERGVMQFYRLRTQDSVLTGILLIAADLNLATGITPVVAYIPHDPINPLRQYPSGQALRAALMQQLSDPDYRQFFSQFVDHAQRTAFFSSLQQRTVFSAERIDGELWPQLYQAALNKILNDGRALAVPTADIDKRARWAWWDTLSQRLEGVINAALLIITPFVPLLGEVMLAYTAYQLLDELVEGVVDLAEGQALEAAGHLVGVVSDVVQLATFSVAGKLAQSAFVNGLQAVDVNGKTRLWNPDPNPYQQTLQLAQDSVPDELGLHTHAGQQILPLDGNHYAVKLDAASGEHRLQHATRPDAYAPPIHHNASPQAWSDLRRLRELGPFDASQREQILRTSAIDHGVLRAVQTEGRSAPLLDDTITRVNLNRQARELPQRLRAGEPVDQDTYWSANMACELPGWPQDWAIQVYEGADLSGESMPFGDAAAPHTLSISHADLNAGRLPERLVDALDPVQLTDLLGALPEARQARIDALRNRLADNLARRHAAVFEQLYRNSEALTSTHSVLVHQACPGLPKNLVRSVLGHARPDELAILDADQRVPLRLKNIARELHLQARGAHAYQGFYEPELFGKDSEQMVLNTLRVYSDSLENCRIEIRQHTPIGSVRASAGPENASHRRVLLKTNGRYALRGDPAPDMDFFDAVLHALPAAKRTALGYAPGEGAAFKGWVMDKLRVPEQRRTVLASPPNGVLPSKAPLELLQKPMQPLVAWANRLFPGTLEQRIKALYPYAEPEALAHYRQTLDDPLQHQRFEAREVEKDQLRHDLSNWINASPAEEAPGVDHQRHYLVKALLRTWEENLAVDETGVRLSLHNVRLSGLLGNLRLQANFEHVLHLEINDSGLLDSDTPLLESFPRLQYLSLRGNQLRQLPQPVTAMTSLINLSLESNPIEWEAAGLGQLSDMTQLRQLSLANNRRLVRAPDIGRQANLEALVLRNTAISEWPHGLFDQPRPGTFHLDLQHTEVTTVPGFLPWQPEARVVAQARLDRNKLTVDAEQKLVSYRLEAGLDPYRTYPPKGDAEFWLENHERLHSHYLKLLWQDIEQEHGSQGFFEVIKSLELPEFFEDEDDAALYQQGRADLTDKVWRMLLAMNDDEALRTRLFQMASNPVTCADAGTYTFNAMGIEVQLLEINRDLRGLERAVKLAYLARGKSRLDRLKQAIEADICQRIKPTTEGGQGLRLSTDVVNGEPGTVDEVEVHLAYHTGLKQRLKLPWVSPHMVYRATADVNLTQLNRAFDRVIRLEAGDGRVDGLLEQPLWDRYLRETHAPAFHASLERANARLDPLDDLMFAQNQWASASTEERDTLKPRLLALADALDVPHADVLTGQPMTAATYTRLFEGAFSDEWPSERNLARRLTRDILQHLEAYESGAATPPPAWPR